jgi:hypothetical protein
MNGKYSKQAGSSKPCIHNVLVDVLTMCATYLHAFIHTYMHIHTHTRARACTHVHTHARARTHTQRPRHSSSSESLASHCGRPGSSPSLVMWDLWWTKWCQGRFSPSTSVSPANLHSTNCSTITLVYHLGLVQ